MKSVNLILLGHGGFGREVAAWVAARGIPFKIQGFLDDENVASEILGPIKGHQPNPAARYLTCFGDGRARQMVREQLEAVGGKFTSLISPDVMTATRIDQSINSIFLGACSISSSVVLGNDVLIQGFAVVGHDVLVGHGVTVSSHAFIGGHAKLSPFCTVHPHAVVLPHVTIGEGAVVGAGTVVIRDVAPYTTVFGLPAKVIAYGKPHD
ncbi:hypothetical protein B0E47_16600 [Rhodanobacter sp. B05]|uniref:PglD-related sugar-binding protein n=1 Tax=Rhodanobacter sp. B05 TaxID=1945859 RepID=UPI000987074B|nr:hypothetical protein [Rhodanobacter sp. B05]OOG52868.1 hypothetical protein B0E47_16600 [Rhodanobacter sp. B05]